MDQKKIEIAIYLAIALTFVLILYNFYMTNTLMNEADKKVEELKKGSILPYLKVTFIDPGCLECRDASPLINGINQSINANISFTKLSPSSASQIISKYGITKLPAVVVEGNISLIENSQLSQLFTKKGNALVFESLPPYIDAKENKLVGIVEVKLIEHKGCSECYNMRNIITSLSNAGVVFSETKVLEHPGEEANKLVKQYNITKFPTLLISKEIDLYGYKDSFSSSDIVKDVGDYYMILPFPPYVEIPGLRLRGEVNVTYLYSTACSNCTDVKMFKDGISRMGIYIRNERELAVEEEKGKELVNKYSIRFVPTVILQGDLEAYPGLIESWRNTGKYINGTLIFTDYSNIQGIFYDLENNSTIGG